MSQEEVKGRNKKGKMEEREGELRKGNWKITSKTFTWNNLENSIMYWQKFFLFIWKEKNPPQQQRFPLPVWKIQFLISGNELSF